jgi:hypothetical protein
MDEKPLEKFFGWIETGNLALPELQRPKVWADSKIPRLLSSIYNTYPFGIFLIWTPKKDERIRCRAFAFDQDKQHHRKQKPSLYLIDGQQRLTAFYKALHPRGDVKVVFDIHKEDFQLWNKKYSEKDGWYEVRHILSFSDRERVVFKDKHRDIGDARLDSIFDKLDHLRSNHILISYFNVEEKPYSDVVEIFERINLGVPVKKSQIVLGKLSTIFPGVVEKVEAILEKLKKQHGNEFDLDLFMSVLAVTATENMDLDDLVEKYHGKNRTQKTSGKTKRNLERDIDNAISAIDKAFAFTDEYLCMDTMRYFPSERTLTCLAFFQSKHPSYFKKRLHAKRIALWTAWALLTRRHGDQRNLAHDMRTIREEPEKISKVLMKSLRLDELNQAIRQLKDMDYPIDRNDVLFGFLYALLRLRRAKSLITTEFEIHTSGREKEKLQEHHIYPKAQAEKDGEKEKWIHDIGNLTLLLGKDNEQLKDPNISYLQSYKKILPAHIVGTKRVYKAGEYMRFLKERRNLIFEALNKFVKELRKNARY